MIAAINASNIVEFILAIIGILGAIISFTFFLANLKIRTQIDQQILTLFQRQQRQYDRLKIIINLQASRLKDVENFLQKDGFYTRAEFPSEGLPSEDTEM